MARPIDIKQPPESTPEAIWTKEVFEALVQRIYELEEKIEEMQNES